MIIITSKIINYDNNYIKNIQRDQWEYLDKKKTELSSLNVKNVKFR